MDEKALNMVLFVKEIQDFSVDKNSAIFPSIMVIIRLLNNVLYVMVEI